MSFLGGLRGTATTARTIQRRTFYHGANHKKSDRIVKTSDGSAYHVVWGDDGDTYIGEAFFPTMKDATRFWEDTEGQPFSEYWHRVPMFFGIQQKTFVELLHYPCEQVDRELCFGAWGEWKKKHGSPRSGARFLRQTVGAGRSLRSRSRIVGSTLDVFDTLDQVEGGGYRVMWHEYVSGRLVTREAFFPTLASAKLFWTERPQGENFSYWFSRYGGINGHWYDQWAANGCAGDNAWLCTGAWGRKYR